MASPFSGRAGRLAGMWAYDQAQNAKLEGQGLIDSARTDALAALGAGFGQARTDLNSNYNTAIGFLNPWTEAGKGALTTLQGSLGLGGDGARDAAVAAYRTSPGYERRVAQASDEVARKASALGTLGSGNTMAAIADRAQGLADEDYGRWQSQISGLSDRGQQAAGMQAGLQSQLGNALGSLGQAQGQSEAGIHTGLANLGMNNLWNATGSQIQAGTGALMAGQNAAANRMNFGMGLANLGAGLFGRFAGGGFGGFGGFGGGLVPGTGGLINYGSGGGY